MIANIVVRNQKGFYFSVWFFFNPFDHTLSSVSFAIFNCGLHYFLLIGFHLLFKVIFIVCVFSHLAPSASAFQFVVFHYCVTNILHRIHEKKPHPGNFLFTDKWIRICNLQSNFFSTRVGSENKTTFIEYLLSSIWWDDFILRFWKGKAHTQCKARGLEPFAQLPGEKLGWHYF